MEVNAFFGLRLKNSRWILDKCYVCQSEEICSVITQRSSGLSHTGARPDKKMHLALKEARLDSFKKETCISDIFNDVTTPTGRFMPLFSV